MLALSLFLAVSAAPIEGATDRQSCLAWLSNQPPYASQSLEEITANDAFFEKASGMYCSSVSMPLYVVGHEQAGKEMAHLERNGVIVGKQARVEELVAEYLRADWQAVAPQRANPPALSDIARRDVMTAFMLDSDADKGIFTETSVTVFSCIRKTVRSATDQSAALEADHQACGLPALKSGIRDEMQARFPGAEDGEIDRLVDDTTRMAIGFAVTAEGFDE